MPRTDVAAATNLTIEPVATYHTDPRGWGMFARLSAAIADVLNGRTGQHVYLAGESFHGYALSPQRMTGAAQLGAARPVVARGSVFSAEKEDNPTSAATDRLFLERATRARR